MAAAKRCENSRHFLETQLRDELFKALNQSLILLLEVADSVVSENMIMHSPVWLIVLIAD